MSEANKQDLLPSGSAAQQDDNFDENWKSFLEHNFSDGEVDAAENPVDPTQAKVNDTTSAASGNDTVVASSGQDTIQSTSGQDSAAASASKDVLEGDAGKDTVETTVDPKLLAAMLGVGDDPKPATSAPAAQGQDGASPKPSGEGSKDEVFMPFTPTFKLQPELVSALFESEDTETRGQALVSLLAAFGNTITHVIEQRHREVYAPAMLANLQSNQTEEVAKTMVFQDFYGAFPELEPYKKAVTKAFEIIHADQGDKPYDMETRNKVGHLARAAVKSAGIVLPDKAEAKAEVEAKPKANLKVKQTPFEAGSSRPDTGGGDNGPADLVSQLSEWA